MREEGRMLLLGVSLVAFQAVLSPALSIQNLAYPSPLVLFWLVLPFAWNPVIGTLVAIGFGVVTDLLFPPGGLQTFCGLWVWILRKSVYQLLHPNLPTDWELMVSPRDLSSTGFFAYAFPLTLMHHLLYIPLAAWRLSGEILAYAGLSAIYSFMWEWIIFELSLRKRHAQV
ncbi:MAG: hypothetical protein N3E49_00180 [Bacteroidia bacterium]|nr:hypothetical protein [Bacteroidia bacterium]